MIILPLVGGISPAISDNMVVFPHPDGPIIETNSPSQQLKLNPLIALISSEGV